VSPKEKIAKLESLLTRVKERAEAPRPIYAAAFAAEPVEAAQPAHALTPASPEPPRVAEIPRPASHSPGATPSVPPMDLMSGWSEPPPPTSADPVLETADLADVTEYESDMDVDVSSEVVEVDIDIDEPAAARPAMPAESGAQPVAEHVSVHPSAEVEIGAADLEAHELEAEEEPHELEAAVHEAETQEVTIVGEAREIHPPPAEAPPANELVEPEPSSSPRPIALPEAESYEEESAPRHTPPPESGKQVAAPSVKPEVRKSSAPPSLEGHTLIGGWRNGEPVVPPREAPRVEETTPAEPSQPSRPPPPAARVPPPPPAAPVLTAEATKPEFPEIVEVAVVEGNVPEFAPKSFGDLLDASLGL
jgi:hypothetical protein